MADLFKNSETAQELMACTPEEAAVLLKNRYQLEFTVEELDDVACGIKAALSESSDELSSSDLEEVVGGAKGSTAYNVGYYIGKSVKVIGTVAGIAGFAISAFGW